MVCINTHILAIYVCMYACIYDTQVYKYTKRLSIGDYVCGSYTCHKYNYSYVTYECADIIIMGTHTVYTLNYIIKYKEGLHHQ